MSVKHFQVKDISKISPGICQLQMVSLQINGHRKNRKSTHESDQNGSATKATNFSYEARLRRLNGPTLK